MDCQDFRFHEKRLASILDVARRAVLLSAQSRLGAVYDIAGADLRKTADGQRVYPNPFREVTSPSLAFLIPTKTADTSQLTLDTEGKC